MREGSHLSILGENWDCKNREGHLRQLPLIQEKPGAQEAICEYSGLGEHLSASSDLLSSKRIPTNGFHLCDGISSSYYV